jgi:hypothetical protein
MLELLLLTGAIAFLFLIPIAVAWAENPPRISRGFRELGHLNSSALSVSLKTPHTARCSKCGSSEFRRSYRRGGFERLFKYVGIVPWRCVRFCERSLWTEGSARFDAPVEAEEDNAQA